jgi:hypothetical protein
LWETVHFEGLFDISFDSFRPMVDGQHTIDLFDVNQISERPNLGRESIWQRDVSAYLEPNTFGPCAV